MWLNTNAFTAQCKRHGIHHEFSVKHTPQMNGTAEHSMRTLHSRARCMLRTSDLGDQMWPFAYQYAAYLYNRSYVQRINATPFYLMHGYKPNVSKFRRFGYNVQRRTQVICSSAVAYPLPDLYNFHWFSILHIY